MQIEALVNSHSCRTLLSTARPYVVLQDLDELELLMKCVVLLGPRDRERRPGPARIDQPKPMPPGGCHRHYQLELGSSRQPGFAIAW